MARFAGSGSHHFAKGQEGGFSERVKSFEPTHEGSFELEVAVLASITP